MIPKQFNYDRWISHRLKPLDVEFMKQLHHKVNIVPVIAKSDAMTKKEILRLKMKVRID